MRFDPTWLRQVSPPPASQNHFNHCQHIPTTTMHGDTELLCKVSDNSGFYDAMEMVVINTCFKESEE